MRTGSLNSKGETNQPNIRESFFFFGEYSNLFSDSNIRSRHVDQLRAVWVQGDKPRYRLFSRNALPVVTRDVFCNWMATQDRS